MLSGESASCDANHIYPGTQLHPRRNSISQHLRKLPDVIEFRISPTGD
jgi:hypothetical protein